MIYTDLCVRWHSRKNPWRTHFVAEGILRLEDHQVLRIGVCAKINPSSFCPSVKIVIVINNPAPELIISRTNILMSPLGEFFAVSDKVEFWIT
jgi:hypothetical protein